MHATPIEDFERLEADVQRLRDEVMNLLEVFMVTDDRAALASAARLALEALKETTVLRPDFELEWELGPDVEVRFEEDDAA